MDAASTDYQSLMHQAKLRLAARSALQQAAIQEDNSTIKLWNLYVGQRLKETIHRKLASLVHMKDALIPVPSVDIPTVMIGADISTVTNMAALATASSESNSTIVNDVVPNWESIGTVPPQDLSHMFKHVPLWGQAFLPRDRSRLCAPPL